MKANEAIATALIGELTGQALEDLKNQNKGGGYSIIVGGHIAYFRNPTRQDINIAAIEQDSDNPMGFFEVIIRETQVGGSSKIAEDEELFKGAVQLIRKKVDGPKARLVNW